MVQSINRIRTVLVTFKNSKATKHVHLCIDCKKEVFISANDEKTHTGYCRVCVRKHRAPVSFKDKTIKKLCSCCNRNYMYRAPGSKGTVCVNCQKLKKFGINFSDYEKMLIVQDNTCKICKNPETTRDPQNNKIRNLSVDHCHETGKIRGLLCTKCNTGIGLFRENIDYLQNAINYLK